MMSMPLAAAGMLVLHLDFNTVQMQRDAVIDCLRVASAAGYNAVLWEVENKVQWETCPECVHPEAFTKAEFREILAEADRLGLEPIPLLQTIGHAEYVLSSPKYVAWREDAENPACYCTSSPEVRRHLKRWLHEYLELFGPKVRHFHLGGDEALAFGTCPKCRTRNKMDLYVEHLEAVAEELVARGIRPGVWADMMMMAGDWSRREEVELDEGELRKLPRAYTLWNWSYRFGYAPEAIPAGARPDNLDFTEKLLGMGYSVIACGASQCYSDTLFVSFYARHRDNLAACACLARKRRLLGCCCTSWSIHLYPKALQYPLWEFTARRYLRPAEKVQEDYAAAVSHWLEGVSPETLDRLGTGGWLFEGFDARGRGYLKPALPAEPGQLARALEYARSGGKEEVAERVGALREEVAKLEAALGEIRPAAKANANVRRLADAAELKKAFVARLADSLEDKPLARLPIAETAAFYAGWQTPISATNAAALAWSVMAQAQGE